MGSSPIPATRPVGQAAKTPPFHGGNGSSILPRVTKKDNIRTTFGCYLFIQAAGLAWNHTPACMASPQAYGITRKRASLSSCGLIPYSSASWFHSLALRAIPYRNKLRISSTATPWFGCERRKIWQRICCLNIPNNWLVILFESTNICKFKGRERNIGYLFVEIFAHRDIIYATRFGNLIKNL